MLVLAFAMVIAQGILVLVLFRVVRSFGAYADSMVRATQSNIDAIREIRELRAEIVYDAPVNYAAEFVYSPKSDRDHVA